MRAIDIIIPVYGAADDLARCLASVAAHTDLERHRVVLVLDGPQETPPHVPGALVLRNERRLGFAASVNRGMQQSSHDVVLLNSDAIVTARWLEKLAEAADSDPKIGTVTPLSNDATLCSVPRSFARNLIPTGFDLDSFAAHVERVSARERPRIPTAVGFCMFIRRALLDEIGLFDAESFAGGYGEENDFCLRATARGWLHVADDATFVSHAGHRSFGASRAARQRRARAAMRRKHPQYMATIAEFMRRDPMAAVRARIAAEPTGELRIVHLVHGWPPFQHAGTELYAYWLAHAQKRAHRVSVYARSEDETAELMDDGVRVRLVRNDFSTRNPLRRNAIVHAEFERDFERFLAEERPDLVHIHHLAGHAFSLARVAKGRGIPVVMQLQDWWSLCARVNLLHRDGTRCGGPAPAKCAACVTLTNLPLMNRPLHALRRRAARAALRAAGAFVAGSEAIRRDYAGVVPASTPFHVIPYGIALDAARSPRPPARKPVRFGFIGSALPHKGFQTAEAAFRGIDPADAVLRRHAGFAEDEKPRVFAEMDVLLVPSIGLESFGLTAREAMASGVPVIAAEGGAMSEMGCGELFPPGDAAALRVIVQRVIDDPALVDRWAAQLPVPKRADDHAAEIERVYRSVL